jgi:hypothetical protein
MDSSFAGSGQLPSDIETAAIPSGVFTAQSILIPTETLLRALGA